MQTILSHRLQLGLSLNCLNNSVWSDTSPESDGVVSVRLDTDFSTGASHTRLRPSIELSSAQTPELAPKVKVDVEMPRAKADIHYPWEGFNRKVHSLDNVLDRFLLQPVAVGYDSITPTSVRPGCHVSSAIFACQPPR